MAGPLSMQVSYDELNDAIGNLRYGKTYSTLSATHQGAVDGWRRNGLRAFYRGDGVHQWSFLKPVTTMTVYGEVTGTVDSSSYSGVTQLTTVNTADDTFYASMAGATITVDDTDYTIAGYTSTTAITISGDVTTAFAAEASFTVSSDGIFALPADLAGTNGIIGNITYAVGSGYGPVRTTGEGRIRRLWEPSIQIAGAPTLAAVRPKAQVSGSQQLYELVTDLVPDDEYVWTYQYRVHPPDVSAANPYPYGAMEHAETILEACLAAAEVDLAVDTHQKRFALLLAQSIETDRRNGSPEVIGRERTLWDVRRKLYLGTKRHSDATWGGFVDSI